MGWFTSKDMDQYVSQQFRTDDPAIDDSANALRVGANLHPAFYELQFIFIPKASGVLITHALGSTIGLRNLYHNATLYEVGSGPQLLFARSLAVFTLLTGFLQRGEHRLLKLATEQEE